MTDSLQKTKVSSYLQYLPALFQQTAGEQAVPFLGHFLLAFEQILSGLDSVTKPGAEENGDFEEILAGLQHGTRLEEILAGLQGGTRGLEEIIDNIDRCFNPLETGKDFLPWLASWTALTLRADWEVAKKRDFIKKIISLYKLRGTRAGLIEMVRTYTGFNVEIQELPFQVGVVSTIGRDTLIQGPPHFFHIKMILQRPEDKEGTEALEQFQLTQKIALAIIDQEKPAHTHYSWLIETPTMRIGYHSTVGVDTFLGSHPQEDAS